MADVIDDEHIEGATLGRARPRTSSSASIAYGQLIEERYLIREKLGVGGMARVFLATDVRLKRDVALKIARPEIVDEAELCARMLVEAELMAKLHHPNIVEIYDVGSWEGRPFLVMPYHAGNDLNAWCRRQGGVPIEPGAVIGIIEKVGMGLEVLHAQGLVHRDVKPHNILITDTLEVMLGDFGLTHHVYEQHRFEELGGTPGFLAPELLLDEPVVPELAHKADVYSLGVTAYWLLTGVLPRTCDPDDLASELTPGLDCEVRPPSERVPTLPVALDAPVLAALCSDPVERTSIAVFRRSLLAARTVDVQRDLRKGKPRLVVLVDDDPMALVLFEACVREVMPHAQIVSSLDPRAAVAIIDDERPDLIITDLDMPHLNGLELTAAVRGRPSTRNTPIIVVTGVGGAADWQQLRQLGATQFLVKPIDPPVLGDVVLRVLGER